MRAEALPLAAERRGLFDLLREDVGCVFARDPAARTTWEVLTTYPGVHAVIAHRLAGMLWRRRWHYLARWVAFVARLLTNVDIHPGAVIGRRLFIDHGAGVVIGETAEIGDDVTLYHGVTLGGTSWRRGKRHPTLKSGVVVGAGAKILGPIILRERVRVGANSVVVKDVPADRTVVGIPGRVVANLRVPDAAYRDGINLDHHLIPDPVGKAMACMIERIRSLEQRLEAAGIEPRGSAAACPVCDGRGCDCDLSRPQPAGSS